MKPSVSKLGARYSPSAWAAAHWGAVEMWRIRRDTSRRLGGDTRPAEVHVAPRLRALDEPVLERRDLEAGIGEQRPHVTGEMAPARESHLPRIEALLESRDL